MPMNGNVLGDAMRAAIEALGSNPSKQDFWRAVGGAVVSHVTGNAVVSSTVTIPVGGVTGVTAGAGVSGTGSGTATGTVA